MTIKHEVQKSNPYQLTDKVRAFGRGLLVGHPFREVALEGIRQGGISNRLTREYLFRLMKMPETLRATYSRKAYELLISGKINEGAQGGVARLYLNGCDTSNPKKVADDLPIRPPQPKGCGFIRAEGQSCVNSALPPKVKTMSFRAELTHEVFALLKTVKFTERMQYELIPLVYIHGNKEHIDELLVGDLICDEAKKWIDTKLPSYLILCDILDGTKFYETAMAKQEAT